MTFLMKVVDGIGFGLGLILIAAVMAKLFGLGFC